MFEVGIAKAKNKPIFFLAQKNSFLPFFIATNYITHYYDRSRLKETLVTPLINQLFKIAQAENIQEEFKLEKEKIKTVFISYCRVDRHYLDRLLVHIRPFERSGNVEIWADDKIEAGESGRKRLKKL